MKSMNSSEKVEDMICDLEGYRWDAVVLNETWRLARSEFWETHHKHIYMGAGKYDNKHGVGILPNKKWRHRIIGTEYISERAITTMIMVNHQRIKLMSVYFTHSRNADHHTEKCTEHLRSTRIPTTRAYRSLEEASTLNWVQDTALSVQVLARTHSMKETKEEIG